MEQLSGLDAAFVHQDSHRTPMHVSAILVYDATEQQLELSQLRELLRDRLWHEPLFRHKLQRVTFDVDTPYWIPAGNTQWRYHLIEHQLPPGQTWESFHQWLQEHHSRRMDLTQPLWQLSLIRGLEDVPGLPGRCQALVLKAHHAAIDGISLARLLRGLHDSSNEEQPAPAPTPAQPKSWEVWSRANLNNISRQFKFADTMGKLINSLPKAREERRNKQQQSPTLGTRAVFNERVGSQRTVGVLLFPRQDLLAIKRAVRGVTENDVASAIIAGGLRKYLKGTKQLPDLSLVAGMPISLRNAGEAAAGSNQIATMAVGLATNIDDPIERVIMIHRFAVAGKREIKALGTGTVMDISDSLPPTVLAEGIRTLAWASQLAPVPVPFHTMISNVPGPGGEQFLEGLPLFACAGLGPVRDNMGLFHIISTTRQTVSLSFSACSGLLRDSKAYRGCIEASFGELYQQATAEQ